MSWIVNANGSLVAPRRGGRSGPLSTKPRADSALCGKAVSLTHHRRGHLQRDGSPPGCAGRQLSIAAVRAGLLEQAIYPQEFQHDPDTHSRPRATAASA
jgi:hypothetical protein